MKIELNKTYLTHHGEKVWVICVDRPHDNYPIVTLQGTHIEAYTAEGRYSVYGPDEKDLVKEYSPWADVAVDTPVWVRFGTNPAWEPYHFAKYEGGKVFVFCIGMTSHSTLGGGHLNGATEASLTRPCV
jgi:hypothetical protein